jgi:preprotein translocase subunit SecY
MYLIRACTPAGLLAGARLERAIRCLAVVLALAQGFIIGAALPETQLIGTETIGLPVTVALACAATVLLLIWLGDLVTRYGIGPGMPLIIATPLLAHLPGIVWLTIAQHRHGAMTDQAMAALLAAIFVTVLASTIVARARYRLPDDPRGRPLSLTLIPAGIAAAICVMTLGVGLDHLVLALIRRHDPDFTGSPLIKLYVEPIVFLLAAHTFGPLLQRPAGGVDAGQIRQLTIVLGAFGGALLAPFVALPDFVMQELLKLHSPITGGEVILLALVMLACLEHVETEVERR